MKPLAVAPFLFVSTDLGEDGALKVSCAPTMPWIIRQLDADLDATEGLDRPYLPRLDRGPAHLPWARFRMPPGPGVTLAALLPTLDTEALGAVSIRLLRTVVAAWPLPMTPLSGMLCASDGQLWIAPPLPSLVDGASRTWNSWQFDEYCISGHSELGHALAFTLIRLLLKVSLPALLVAEPGSAPRVSTVLPWLQPLDELVAAAFSSSQTDVPDRATWVERLAVLDDRCQELGVAPLEARIIAAYVEAPDSARW